MKVKKTNNDFQTFWDAYALKRDKIAAERAWNRLSASDRRAALNGIDRYKADCERRGISRMYAQGYLTHRRWEDEGIDFEAESGSSTGMAVPNDGELGDMERW